MRVDVISPHGDKTRHWAAVIGLSAVLVLSMGAPLHMHYGLPCLFKLVFGFPCAGCGMARAFLLIGHGHFLQAFQLNPNAPLVFLGVVILWANELFFLYKGMQGRLVLTKRELVLVCGGVAFMTAAVWIRTIVINPNI
jgi:hypothetical protein